MLFGVEGVRNEILVFGPRYRCGYGNSLDLVNMFVELKSFMTSSRKQRAEPR